MPLLLFFNYPIKNYLLLRETKPEKAADYIKIRFYFL